MSLVADILKLDQERDYAVREAARLRAELEREKSKYDFLLPPHVRAGGSLRSYRHPSVFGTGVVVEVQSQSFKMQVSELELAQVRSVQPFIATVARDMARKFHERLATQIAQAIVREGASS